MARPALMLLGAIAALLLLAATPWPTCDGAAPRDLRIGGVILIGGCP